MDTMGWDTVYVVAAARVNDGLRANLGKLVTSFSYDDGMVRFSGEFGVWELVPGGSDRNLRFRTPIVAGTLEAFGQKYDLAGVSPELDLQLAFIDGAATGTHRNLVFDLRVPGTGPGDDTHGAVTTIDPDTSKRITTSSPAWGILHDALPKCLIAHRQQLAYVFASVNLVPPGAVSWLAPKAYEYVYVQPATGAAGYLTVLASVSQRDVSALPRKVDTSLLDGRHDVYFAISPDLFMREVVLPTLPGAYGHGATTANFRESNATITNNGSLDCGSFREGLIDYHPHLDSLTISIDGDQLRSSANGSFPITGLTDAYVTFSLGNTSTCQYDRASNQIRFVATGSPTHSYDTHIPWWEEAIGALGGPIVLAIVDGVTLAVTEAVASGVSSSLASGGGASIASAAPVTVRWQGLEAFGVQEAGLSTSFYLRGAFA